MAIKLLLNPKADPQPVTHPESGVTFRINPLSPARFEELRRGSIGKGGVADIAKFNAGLAMEVIADWGDDIGDETGPLPCDDANKATFGRLQALNIMPWLIDQAMGLDNFRVEEETAAKKG